MKVMHIPVTESLAELPFKNTEPKYLFSEHGKLTLPSLKPALRSNGGQNRPELDKRFDMKNFGLRSIKSGSSGIEPRTGRSEELPEREPSIKDLIDKFESLSSNEQTGLPNKKEESTDAKPNKPLRRNPPTSPIMRENHSNLESSKLNEMPPDTLELAREYNIADPSLERCDSDINDDNRSNSRCSAYDADESSGMSDLSPHVPDGKSLSGDSLGGRAHGLPIEVKVEVLTPGERKRSTQMPISATGLNEVCELRYSRDSSSSCFTSVGEQNYLSRSEIRRADNAPDLLVIERNESNLLPASENGNRKWFQKFGSLFMRPVKKAFNWFRNLFRRNHERAWVDLPAEGGGIIDNESNRFSSQRRGDASYGSLDASLVTGGRRQSERDIDGPASLAAEIPEASEGAGEFNGLQSVESSRPTANASGSRQSENETIEADSSSSRFEINSHALRGDTRYQRKWYQKGPFRILNIIFSFVSGLFRRKSRRVKG